MIEGGWRRTGALVAHEAGAACARIDSWIVRWVLGAGSSAIVLAAASFGYIDEAMGLLGFGVYLVLIGVLPWITLGALRERRSGRIELLAASPLGDRQVFVALVGARFLSAVHILVGVAPAIMIVAWGAGAAGVGRAAGTATCVLAAAWLATSYAAFQAVRGVRERAVWTRLAVFVMATPFALFGDRVESADLSPCPDVQPVRARSSKLAQITIQIVALVIYIVVVRTIGPAIIGAVKTVMQTLGVVIICGAFPFWTLGYHLLGGWSPTGAAAALGVAFLLGTGLSRGTARRFPAWLRVVEEVDEREDASSPQPKSETDSYPRRRLASIRGPANALYRLSRRNAYVVREILREDHVGEFLPVLLLFFLGVAWHLVEMGAVSPERADAGALAAVLGLLPCCSLSALEGSRAIPARGTTAMDVLLSTPIGGWRIVSGSVLAIFLRFRFALPVYLVMGLVTTRGFHPERAPAFLILGASLLALAHAVGLWTRFLGPSRKGRVPIVLGVCAILAVATGAFWPEGTPAHPLRAWYSPDAAIIYLSGAITCVLALLLCGFLAARFRRIAALRL